MKINNLTIKTPTMKRILSSTLVMLALASCSKSGDVAQKPIDPNKKYSVGFDIANQQVKTSVVNDTLHLDFYQQVSFLLDPSEYSTTWAIGAVQDFSKSYLNNLHFTCLAEYGNYAYDWATINLNDVNPSQKTTKDTTVNGKKYEKVTLARTFYFFNPLGSSQAALDKQNALLQTKTDSVSYQVFYLYDGVTSIPSSVTANVSYSKK